MFHVIRARSVGAIPSALNAVRLKLKTRTNQATVRIRIRKPGQTHPNSPRVNQQLLVSHSFQMFAMGSPLRHDRREVELPLQNLEFSGSATLMRGVRQLPRFARAEIGHSIDLSTAIASRAARRNFDQTNPRWIADARGKHSKFAVIRDLRGSQPDRRVRGGIATLAMCAEKLPLSFIDEALVPINFPHGSWHELAPFVRIIEERAVDACRIALEDGALPEGRQHSACLLLANALD